MTRTRRLAGLVVPLLLTVVLVALLATAGWFAYQRSRTQDDGAAALASGRTAAVLFFSLDHAHPGANIDRLLARSTGAFKKEYAAQRGTLEKAVTDRQVTVRASVPGSGTALELLSPQRAQVLVAVDATTSLPDGHSEKSAYRTRVVLVRVGEQWLVAGLEQVG